MRLAYRAWDAAGRLIADVVDAASAEEAKEHLRRRGLFVTEINEANRTAAASPRSRRFSFKLKAGRGTRLKHLSAFSRQLYVLVKTGTPIVQALEAVERQTRDETFKRAVNAVRSKVEEGVPLSEAMAARPEYFDGLSRSLIAAGETAGKLPLMLERIGNLARKEVKIRSNIIGSMVYPALLISVSVSVLATMMMVVLPRFAELFENLGAAVPPSTQALMQISDAMRTYWWAVAGGIAVVVGGFVKWQSTATGKRARDRMLLRLPFIGGIIRNFATARIARLMGILLDSYLPLLDVIRLVRESMGHHEYDAVLARAEQAVIDGQAMSTAFEDGRVINSSMYEALRNGEQSGQIAPLMTTVADFLDEDNEVVVKSLTSILEPVILIGLGLVIGFVAVSMFLPLFDLTASASAPQ
jgi:type II secretory pathway component PulF